LHRPLDGEAVPEIAAVRQRLGQVMQSATTEFGFARGREHRLSEEARASFFFKQQCTLFRCQQVFEKVSRDTDVSAWVGLNDSTALAAREWIQDHTPTRELSLVGFDNSVQSMYANMTSYDFNLGATARAAIDFVLRPNLKRPSSEAEVVHIDGMLMKRGSTTSISRQ
jgi:DNA-binding LacI/PurR family transcriptional regulator